MGRPEEAILDVVAAWPVTGRAWWLDITLRSAHAARYAGAERTPGLAAARAVAEKAAPYGAAVTTLAIESLGHMAPDSLAALPALLRESQTFGLPLAGSGAVVSLRRLRLALEAARRRTRFCWRLALVPPWRWAGPMPASSRSAMRRGPGRRRDLWQLGPAGSGSARECAD